MDMRHNILSNNMPVSVATRILTDVNPDTPWETKYLFVQALAALCTLHSDEMKRRTDCSSQTTRKLIWNATSPARLEWYFNNQRMRHMAGAGITLLTGSGTSTNEAFHREVNSWYNNQPELYASTIELQLRYARFGRMLAQSGALFSPTVRTLSQSEVMSRSIAHVRQPLDTWAERCMCGGSGQVPVNQKKHLVLMQQQEQERKAIAASKTSKGFTTRALTGPSLTTGRRVRMHAKTAGATATAKPRVRLTTKTPALALVHRHCGVILKRPATSAAVSVIKAAWPGPAAKKRTPFSLKRTRKLVRGKGKLVPPRST